MLFSYLEFWYNERCTENIAYKHHLQNVFSSLATWVFLVVTRNGLWRNITFIIHLPQKNIHFSLKLGFAITLHGIWGLIFIDRREVKHLWSLATVGGKSHTNAYPHWQFLSIHYTHKWWRKRREGRGREGGVRIMTRFIHISSKACDVIYRDTMLLQTLFWSREMFVILS